jgi:hypothetical protein
MNKTNGLTDEVRERVSALSDEQASEKQGLQLPLAVEKAINAKKARQSNAPMSLLNLPPTPAGMPMTHGPV